MDRQILNITANEQMLTVDEPIRISTNKVNYIEVHFTLGDNWSGYDSVRAVWFNDFQCISTVLDSQGVTFVPFEVMKRKGNVKVNLVGSISENDVLTDRLTSYPVVAVIVDCIAQITGANTSPITPSEFEQFAQRVHTDADRAEQGASSAQIYAGMASNEAESASQSAQSAHDDKIAIEQAIAEVIQQIEDFEQVQVVANTLPPTSPATSDFTDGVLTLGIPQGVKGDTGNGIQSIAKTGTSGLVDTYTITYTDGQTTTFNVTNGAKGDTGNGIASIEKTSTVGLVDTYTITYTNGTTTTFTVTNGEKGDKGEQGDVSLAQLYAVYPTDTASGSIASFLDGADNVPMRSVKAQIEPIQDLHGYDKPWSGGAGVNVLDPNIKFPSGDNFGLTVTTDGYNYKFVGTATSSGAFETNAINSADAIILPAGDYYLKSGRADLRKPNGTPIVNQWAGAFTMTEPFYVRNIYWTIASGQTYNSENFIELVKGSTAPTQWTPYSNICPISGHTQSVVEQRGINVWDEEWELGYYSLSNGSPASASGECRCKNKIRVLPNATYYFHRGSSGVKGDILYYTENDTFISGVRDNGNNSFTTPSTCAYVRFNFGNDYGSTYNHDISINYPSTDHDYHAYQGDTTTTQFGQTVYGGSVDLVSGVLTVDRVSAEYDGSSDESWQKYGASSASDYAMIIAPPNIRFQQSTVTAWSNYLPSVDNGQTWGNYDTFISVTGIAGGIMVTGIRTITTEADWRAYLAEHPLQVVYELATPTTIQLTPQEIDSFKATNNLWASTGEIEVEYRADIGLYIATHGGGSYDTWNGGSY